MAHKASEAAWSNVFIINTSSFDDLWLSEKEAADPTENQQLLFRLCFDVVTCHRQFSVIENLL